MGLCHRHCQRAPVPLDTLHLYNPQAAETRTVDPIFVAKKEKWRMGVVEVEEWGTAARAAGYLLSESSCHPQRTTELIVVVAAFAVAVAAG